MVARIVFQKQDRFSIYNFKVALIFIKLEPD